MTEAQRTILLSDPSLAAVTGLPTYQKAIAQLYEKPGTAKATGLPTGFNFLNSKTGDIPSLTTGIAFTGVMTDTQRTNLLGLTDVNSTLSIIRRLMNGFSNPEWQ